MNQPHQQQINVEIGEKEAEGVYANLAMIANSPTEIIIDFARVMPRTPKARVQARIIMTPMHAKLLHKALGEYIARFGKREAPPVCTVGFGRPSTWTTGRS